MSVELTFGRSIALLAAAERHVDAHLAAFVDRDDIAGTRLLLETLHKIVEDAQRQVIAVQRELDEQPPSPVQLERQVRHVQSIARNTVRLTGEPLHYVTSPHGREFDPLAIAYGRMARQIEPRTELIFRGSEHRGYALSPPLLDLLVQNLIARSSELVEQVERLPTILYLQYPALAEGDVLQHILIAHEVAHLALRRSKGESTDAEQRFEKALRDVKGTSNESSPHLTVPRVKGPVVKKPSPRERAIRWFTEIACDIMGVRLGGPAYYLALCEHALVRQWFYAESEASTHPHLAWRLAKAAGELERFYDAMDRPLRERTSTLIQPYVEIVPDPTPEIEKEPYAEVIELALEQLVADLNEDETIEQAALAPDLLATEAPLVLERLEAGVAPAERIMWSREQVVEWKGIPDSRPSPWSTPLDWRSILNGGYLYLLETAPPQPPPLRGAWSKANDLRRGIVDHLRGSVELSEFHRAAAAVDDLRVLEPQAIA